MKKLFNLKECSESEPMDPGPGSTAEEVYDYNNEWGAWLNSCILELGKQPTSEPPIINVYPAKFEDTKGYIWTRTISAEGIDFHFDFFDIPKKLKSLSLTNSDTLLIIGIRISLTDDYSILALSQHGIKMQKLKRNKVKLVNLLRTISNHVRIPNVDLNNISNDFWDKQKSTMTKNV